MVEYQRSVELLGSIAGLCFNDLNKKNVPIGKWNRNSSNSENSLNANKRKRLCVLRNIINACLRNVITLFRICYPSYTGKTVILITITILKMTAGSVFRRKEGRDDGINGEKGGKAGSENPIVDPHITCKVRKQEYEENEGEKEIYKTKEEEIKIVIPTKNTNVVINYR